MKRARRRYEATTLNPKPQTLNPLKLGFMEFRLWGFNLKGSEVWGH